MHTYNWDVCDDSYFEASRDTNEKKKCYGFLGGGGVRVKEASVKRGYGNWEIEGKHMQI